MTPEHFNKEYAAAIQDYLTGQGEAALRRAYEAGRRALADGLGVLGIFAVHQAALTSALRSAKNQEEERVLGRAFGCFAESLSPFEMVLRGVQETNIRLQHSLSSLQRVEEQLRRQNEELTAAHRTLEKERRRYQVLFDFAPDSYLVTGMEGAIWEANAAAAALLRTPKELLPGQSLCEFVTEADRDAFRERLKALHSGSIERVGDWEIGIQPGNGPVIPAALTVVSERSAPAVASLRWLIRDVTERKRLEEERTGWLVSRAKAKAALRFEFLAEASALLVGSLDIEGSLISVARLAATFLRGWCFICVVEPDGSLRQVEVAHAEPPFDDLARQLRAHRLFGRMTEDEYGRQLRNSREIEPLSLEWFAEAADSPPHAVLLRQIGGRGATVLPLRIHERLVGVMTLVRTFASRRYRAADRVLYDDLARRCALAVENARLYQEMVAQRDKAERASRAKDEFVAILGHELRNPLTPVVGWTRILKNHGTILEDPVLTEGVRTMDKNAAALTRLVSDCLDLARISEGKIQIERNSVDLNQVVTATVAGIREIAAEHGLRVETSLSPAPVPILGDAMRLEQVVMNLLTNAVKYTERDGVISIRTLTVDEQAEVEVNDTGSGIDPAFLEQIFEPYRQGTRTWLTSKSGLGLGLAIARRIVEMHGGRVWAESKGLGWGSAFRVRLPLASSATSAEAVDAPAAVPAGRSRNLRILLIEDSYDICFLMKMDLEGMGHTVATASDGRLALETARSEPPDLIISDIKMPLVDGYEVIRTLRRMPELRNTPAIAMTGFGSKAEIEKALAAGFDAYLSKPADPGKIAALIEQLTERKHAVSAATQSS